MNLPTAITYIRFVLAPLIVLTILKKNIGLTLAILGIAALSDILDGYLARKLNQTTKLGAALDPVADKVFIITAIISLGAAADISLLNVIMVLTRDILLGIGSLIAISVLRGQNLNIKARPLGKLTTVFQMIALPFILLKLPYLQIIVYISFVTGLAAAIDYYKIFNARTKRHHL